MDAQARSDAYYDRLAGAYEDEPGHGIHGPIERQAWDLELVPLFAQLPRGGRVLDVGCGTGVFSRLLADHGFAVHGIDPSSTSIAQAMRSTPPEYAGRLTFQVGDTHDATAAEPESFDAVASRQVVCHLHDPLAAFRHWLAWLKPGGIVLVIDGFWSRRGWVQGPQAADIDALPLCCVQTAGTLAYLLREAGFAVAPPSFLDRVNACVAAAEPGATERSPRYAVVGRKP